MFWQLPPDPSLVYRQEYRDELVKLFGGDRGLAVVKMKDGAPSFIMGNKTPFKMGIRDLPILLQDLIFDALRSLACDAPYVFLVMCGKGHPISKHIHKDFVHVPTFQPTVVLKEGPVNGVTFGQTTGNLHTNRALLNVRELHWVEPQDSDTIWVTPLGGVM